MSFKKLISLKQYEKMKYRLKEIPPGVGPVSYTHLDVYKRQVMKQAK